MILDPLSLYEAPASTLQIKASLQMIRWEQRTDQFEVHPSETVYTLPAGATLTFRRGHAFVEGEHLGAPWTVEFDLANYAEFEVESVEALS